MFYLGLNPGSPLHCPRQNVERILDVDVDVEDLRAQANASMPASYIANYIYWNNTNI